MYILICKKFHETIVLSQQQSMLTKFKETGPPEVDSFFSRPATEEIFEQLPSFVKQKIVHSMRRKWGRAVEWNAFPFLHIRLYIVFFQPQPPPAGAFVDIARFVQSIFLFFGKNMAHKSGLRRLNFYLFLSDLKKTFPEVPQTPFQIINVNSGFTFFSTADPTIKDICIFRKEEWEKVTIHEIIHALNIEFTNASSKQLDIMMGKYIFKHQVTATSPPYPPLRLFETYVELWATILHILFSLGNGGVGGRFCEKEFERKLQKEQAWAVIQYMRILQWGGQSSQRKARSSALTPAQLLTMEKRFVSIDETNTYAYFLLKARFLLQLPLFFQFTGASIYFEKTIEKLLQFFDCIVKLYSPPISHEWAQICGGDENGMGDVWNHFKIIYPNSLRMTVTSS